MIFLLTPLVFFSVITGYLIIITVWKRIVLHQVSVVLNNSPITGNRLIIERDGLQAVISFSDFYGPLHFIIPALGIVIKPPDGKAFPLKIDKYLTPKLYDLMGLMTSDYKLDRLVRISSDDNVRASALFDYNLRSILIKYYSGSRFFKVGYDRISLTLLFSIGGNHTVSLDNMFSIASRLLSGKTTGEMLMEIIKSDPDNNVRDRCFSKLRYADLADGFISEIEKLLDDDDPTIVCHAAAVVGEKGILKVIKLIKKDNYDYSYIDNAVDALQEYLLKTDNGTGFYQQIYSELVDIIEKRNQYATLVATEALLKIPAMDCSSQLVKMLQSDFGQKVSWADGHLIDIMKYFSGNKSSAVFDWVVTGLKKKNQDVVLQAIATLVTLANVNAVEFLKPLARWSFSSQVRHDADQAIHLLQQDIPGSLDGTLSVSDSNVSGDLTLSDNSDSGAMSIDNTQDNSGMEQHDE